MRYTLAASKTVMPHRFPTTPREPWEAKNGPYPTWHSSNTGRHPPQSLQAHRRQV